MTESYSLRWLKTMRESAVSLQSLLICHAQHTSKKEAFLDWALKRTFNPGNLKAW